MWSKLTLKQRRRSKGKSRGEGAENKTGHSIFFFFSSKLLIKRGGMVLLYLRNYGNVKCGRYQNQNVADQVFDV